MDAEKIAEGLMTLVGNEIDNAYDREGDDGCEDILPGLRGVDSWGDAGVLTMDAGFVLRMADGTEYQVTIVRSR